MSRIVFDRVAGLIASTTCVAPRSRAVASFDSTMSTAMIWRAPAMRAPWMAARPTPPRRRRQRSSRRSPSPCSGRADAGRHAAADEGGAARRACRPASSRPRSRARASSRRSVERFDELVHGVAVPGVLRLVVNAGVRTSAVVTEAHAPLRQCSQMPAEDGQAGDDVVARLHST